MTNQKFSILLIIYTFLVLLLTLYSASIINKKNEEIDNLNMLIKEYKSQLQEIPTIIESNKEEICN